MTLSQMRRRLRVFWRGNPLLRLLAVNAAIGFGLSALFVGALASLDLGHMGRLLSGGEARPFAIVLWFFTGLTFASVQMGIAVMALARGGGGGARRRVKPRPMTARGPAVVRVRG